MPISWKTKPLDKPIKYFILRFRFIFAQGITTFAIVPISRDAYYTYIIIYI